MYSARSSTYRTCIFNRVCKSFVNDGIAYGNALSRFLPDNREINTTKSILVDWEDVAIQTNNPNTALMDLVLDDLLILN